jgi:hypothetical protein
MSTWITIGVIWLVVGLLCYAAILRFFPPTPRIHLSPLGSTSEGVQLRPFSIRDFPQVAVILIPTAILSPLLLVVLICYRFRKPKDAAPK